MKLLVFLQNAYGVSSGYVPSFYLERFSKSQTGRRLKEIIPNGVEEVFIRNCTPLIGDSVDSNLPPKQEYMYEQITEIKPDCIIACGNNAKKAIRQIPTTVPIIEMPHPAYRALSKNMTKAVKLNLQKLMEA